MEFLPRHRLALAASIDPAKEATCNFMVEVNEFWSVTSESIVVVVPSQFCFCCVPEFLETYFVSVLLNPCIIFVDLFV